MKRKSEYKPLLFTTTVRNPKRIKGLLNILSNFNNKILTDELAEKSKLWNNVINKDKIKVYRIK